MMHPDMEAAVNRDPNVPSWSQNAAIIVLRKDPSRPYAVGQDFPQYLGDLSKVMLNDFKSALLTVLLLFVAYYFWTRMVSPLLFGTKDKKEPMLCNRDEAGNHPHWQMGAMDAGDGGPLGRSSTHQQLAPFIPEFRQHGSCITNEGWSPKPYWQNRHKKNTHRKNGQEDLENPEPSKCPPGYRLRERENADGTFSQECIRRDAVLMDFNDSKCEGSWSPAATSEALALSALGNNYTSRYDGEARLHNAVIEVSTDVTPSGLTDTQLTDLMHNGETP